jgi:hypothetical protein
MAVTSSRRLVALAACVIFMFARSTRAHDERDACVEVRAA